MHGRNFIPTFLAVLGLALSRVGTFAQSPPALDWALVDGISGVSGNGEIAMIGTISPADSWLMTNGAISIHSVFDPWPGNFSFVLPTLHISLATNDVVIRWSDRYSRLQLEQTTALNESATNWTDVWETAVLTNFEWHVSVPATNRSRFFRLRLFSD